MVLTTTHWQNLISDLYLLNRVHNSPDFEKALHIIQDSVQALGFRGSVRILEYPAGSEYNYWIVPPRWVVHQFTLSDSKGRVIIDHNNHPLVLTPFSHSYEGNLRREDLLKHVHVRQDLPEAIPFIFRRMYRHWEKGWSLALPKNLVDTLGDEHYHVKIQTEFRDEPMKLLEYTVPGRSSKTIQFAAHLDHPGQCNDSLSGVVGALCAVHEIEQRCPKTEFSYSILVCPEIVGSSVYLFNEKKVARSIVYNLCPNMLGHEAPLAMCRSKMGDSLMDVALHMALLSSGAEYVVGEWHKYPDCGDEISYDAPDLDIPASTLSRIGELFPYYHTSLDTPDSINPARFEEATGLMADACSYLERNALPIQRFSGLPALANPNLNLYLEPRNMSNQLNPLCDDTMVDLKTGEPIDLRLFQEFFLSNISGNATLLDIAYEFAISFDFVESYARAFADKGLLELKVPVSTTDYERKITRTAKTRSSSRSFRK